MVPWPEIPRSNLFCAFGSGGRSLSHPARTRLKLASRIERKKAFIRDVIAGGMGKWK
jgi:hypothetical protein